MAYTTVTANAGTGGHDFNVDRVSSVDTPVSKIAWGVEGTITPVTAAAPLPVTEADGGNVALGATSDAASVSTTLSAKLRGIATALGITALDLGTGTGGSRTLRFFKDTAQWIGGAGAVTSAVQRVTLPSDDPAVTAITNSALPVGQGTVSAAGRVTVVGGGLSASVSVTRPSDTTAYTAGDVVGVTGGVTATITFALGAISGERILITSIRLQRNATAVISGETNYRIHWFSVTQPAAQADNAVFDVAAGDQASYLGYSDLVTPIDLGSTLISENNGINKQVKLAGTSLFGVLQTIGAYTPASAAVHVIDVEAIQL